MSDSELNQPSCSVIQPDKIWGWCPFLKKHTWLYNSTCPLTGAEMWTSTVPIYLQNGKVNYER